VLARTGLPWIAAAVAAGLAAGCVAEVPETSPAATPPEATDSIWLERLDESRAVWESLRDATGGTYQYERHQVGFAPPFQMFFAVEDGVVVGRRLVFDGVEQWAETGADVGTHDGLPPLTIDELYDVCASDFLRRDEREYRLGFERLANGVLGTCVADKLHCSDCAEGVSIRAVTLAP